MLKEEADIREKEEDPLLDHLDEFGEEKKVHDIVAAEFKKTRKQLAARSMSLLERASDQSAYLKLLDERAQAARDLLARPTDELEREQTLVDQLEREIEEIASQIPPDISPDVLEGLSARREETHTIEAANYLKAQELQYRQEMIELRRKEIESREINVEALKKHARDESMDMISLRESTARFAMTAEEIMRRKKRKADLDTRKAKAAQQKAELEADIERSGIQLEEDKAHLVEMEGEIARLRTVVREYDALRLQFDAMLSARQQLVIDIGNAEDESARLQRKQKKQGPELEAIQSRVREAEAKKAACDEASVPLKERQREIGARKADLAQTQDTVAELRKTVSALRKSSKELQIEERRTEEALKTAQRKAAQAEEDLRAKADAVFEAGHYPDALNALLGQVEENPD
jgi:myosin heavy subunit